MKYRDLGRTGWKVSEVSFGAWAIGGTWGPVEDTDSLAAMHKAVDMGVNFFDYKLKVVKKSFSVTTISIKNKNLLL